MVIGDWFLVWEMLEVVGLEVFEMDGFVLVFYLVVMFLF